MLINMFILLIIFVCFHLFFLDFNGFSPYNVEDTPNFDQIENYERGDRL